MKLYQCWGGTPLRKLGTVEATSADEAVWEYNCGVDSTQSRAIIARPDVLPLKDLDEPRKPLAALKLSR